MSLTTRELSPSPNRSKSTSPVDKSPNQVSENEEIMQKVEQFF